MESHTSSISNLSLVAFVICISMSAVGCAKRDAAHSPVRQRYTIVYVDTLLFSDNNVFAAVSTSGDTVYLISQKARKGDLHPGSDYEIVEWGSTYELSLSRLASPQILTIRGSRVPASYHIFDILFWSADTVRAPVHSSPQVHSKYFQVLR